AIRMVNVAGPFGRVPVWAEAELRKQIELQMIVSIDQARKHLEACQVEKGTGAFHCHMREHLASSTAGAAQASSKSCGLPASSNRLRSASPIDASLHSSSSNPAASRSSARLYG